MAEHPDDRNRGDGERHVADGGDVAGAFPEVCERPIPGGRDSTTARRESHNVMRPLMQTAGGATPMEVTFPDCPPPLASTTCTLPDGAPVNAATATNGTGAVCRAAIGGTTGGYTPVITTPSGACFASGEQTLSVDLGGVLVTLQNARVAAVYSGNPATGLVNGLIRGFVSEAAADSTILSEDLALIGGEPLSSILKGGDGNCASGDDRDVGPDGVTLGWWFYLNFTASVRPYVD